ncbi:MAG: Crp/Fnr family transcriptional regulator [Treponema sp.]|nr:Crp/Fnr family transcriptional regulator [Treponema sp.]
MPPLDTPAAAAPDDGVPAALAALGFRRSVAAGSLVFRQDERAESCFLLERGEIALRRLSRSGDEVEIARIGEGEWFGEIILFASRAFPAQAVAVRDSDLREFRRSAILGSPHPEVGSFFLALLAHKCLTLNRRIEQLTVMDTRERLARFIIGLCPGGGRGCEGGLEACSFPLPRKKREIAIELGMAPETLSRALRQMEEEGYITVRGSRLEIPSCDFLRSLIEDD